MTPEEEFTSPMALAFLALVIGVAVVLALASYVFVQIRRTRMTAAQEETLRQLVNRYEHLAENVLDAQQRSAADVAELRSRTAAIEQILRTVE